MANMTIENIGRLVQTGDVERVIDRGQLAERPVPPDLRGGGAGEGRSFLDYLSESVDKANEIQLQADHAAKELMAGRNKNIHETMLMLEKADMSFRLMMQVRNKVIEAYREIMRMQV